MTDKKRESRNIEDRRFETDKPHSNMVSTMVKYTAKVEALAPVLGVARAQTHLQNLGAAEGFKDAVTKYDVLNTPGLSANTKSLVQVRRMINTGRDMARVSPQSELVAKNGAGLNALSEAFQTATRAHAQQTAQADTGGTFERVYTKGPKAGVTETVRKR